MSDRELRSLGPVDKNLTPGKTRSGSRIRGRTLSEPVIFQQQREDTNITESEEEVELFSDADDSTVIEHTPDIHSSTTMATKEEIEQIITDALALQLAPINKQLEDMKRQQQNMKKEIEDLQDSDPIARLNNILSQTPQSQPTPGPAMAIPFSPPRFDVRRKSAETYLADLETHLKTWKYTESTFLDVVKSFLPDDCKQWFAAHRSDFTNWEKFKEDFKARFDGTSERNKRLRLLTTRKQGLADPTEPWIYDQLELARNCFPKDDEETLLTFVQQSLHPRVAAGLENRDYPNVDDLIRACAAVTEKAVALDKSCRKKPEVPFMVEHKKTDKHHSSHKGDSSRESYGALSEEDNPGHNSRSRRRQRRHKDGVDRSQQQADTNSRDASGDSQGDSGKVHNKSAKSNVFSNPSEKEMICFKCGGRGHPKRVCPTTQNCVMYDEAEDSYHQEN